MGIGGGDAEVHDIRADHRVSQTGSGSGGPVMTRATMIKGPWEIVWLKGDRLGSPSEVRVAGTDNRVAFLASNGTLGTARLIAAAPDLLRLLLRYRRETPLGHSPHMIAGEVDTLVEEITGAAP